MRRFYKQIVLGLLLAVFVSSTATASANALQPPALNTQNAIAPLTTFADAFEIGELKCGGDDAITFSTSGIDVHGDAIITNYIICPVLSGVYYGIALVIKTIESSGLLEVQPLLKYGTGSASGSDSAGIFGAWTVMRDLANFGLVIGLFLVIFSQATSYGLSAYGVRKMLPKIVIAALLINLSYIICAILVDVFNILGTSLDDALTGAIATAVNDDTLSAGGILTDNNGIASTAVNAAGAVIVMAFMMLLILFLLLIFGIFCLFFLIARQILIICLIVAAPLAFIAWLFPNTESYFRKWWSTLIRLLAIYPVVMCLNAVVLVVMIALSALMERT